MTDIRTVGNKDAAMASLVYVRLYRRVLAVCRSKSSWNRRLVVCVQMSLHSVVSFAEQHNTVYFVFEKIKIL